jgi:hypothetical protein
MAQIISLVVYEINGVKLKQTQTLGFSVDNFIVYPYTGTNISLQSTIEVLSNDVSKTFSVVESQATIRDLANAGGGGGGISLATNGLTIYDDIAVGLGGNLTQDETIIEGNNFLWRTASLNDNTQGFNLNFDSQVYSFGVIENEELHSYIEFGDAYIQNVVSDDNNGTYLTQYQTINEFSLDIGVNVGDEIFNWIPFFASPSYTYIRHNNTDFESEAYNTIEGQFKITANAENFTLHYNFINMPVYTDNATAIANGLSIGDMYRTGDNLKIVN